MWLVHYAKNLLLAQLAYSTEILVRIAFVSKLDPNDALQVSEVTSKRVNGEGLRQHDIYGTHLSRIFFLCFIDHHHTFALK